jgi:hypothetical protein
MSAPIIAAPDTSAPNKSTLLGALRRYRQWCLRPFKAAARPWFQRQVRTLSARFADDLVPLGELAQRCDAIEARQARLEALRWDHVALGRRLAALEDHVESLLRREAAQAMPSDEIAPPALVPFGPDDGHPAASGASNAPSRWQRA